MTLQKQVVQSDTEFRLFLQSHWSDHHCQGGRIEYMMQKDPNNFLCPPTSYPCLIIYHTYWSKEHSRHPLPTLEYIFIYPSDIPEPLVSDEATARAMEIRQDEIRRGRVFRHKNGGTYIVSQDGFPFEPMIPHAIGEDSTIIYAQRAGKNNKPFGPRRQMRLDGIMEWL
jgi:hypothetical protein